MYKERLNRIAEQRALNNKFIFDTPELEYKEGKTNLKLIDYLHKKEKELIKISETYNLDPQLVIARMFTNLINYINKGKSSVNTYQFLNDEILLLQKQINNMNKSNAALMKENINLHWKIIEKFEELNNEIKDEPCEEFKGLVPWILNH